MFEIKDGKVCKKEYRDFCDIPVFVNMPEYVSISRLKKNVAERKRKKLFKRNVKGFVKV